MVLFKNGINATKNISQGYYQSVEPNLNPNEPFHFGEPETNLNR